MLADTIMFVLWYCTGVAGFVYWYTKDYAINWKDIPAMLFVGLCGPLAWLMGYLIHGR